VALAVVLFIRTRPVPFQRSSPALKTFWADFLAPDALDPLIEFSTGDYVGSEITGMWIRKRPDEGPRIDTHTGIGELIATSALTRNFVTLGRPAQLKGAEFLTWDEARDRNIVFLGSPVTNRPLRDVPRLQDFGFKLRTEEPRMDDAALVNFHPGPGEQNYYFYSSSAPDTKDYAVIALAPSTDLSRRALILAGITTVSTQAAGEFVCRPESVAELLARLGVRSGARVPDFEAVLEITRIGAVPIKSQLLIVRVREK